jgi:hypothetical protein
MRVNKGISEMQIRQSSPDWSNMCMGNGWGGGFKVLHSNYVQQEYQKSATALGAFSYVRPLHIIVLDLRSHKVTLLHWEMKICCFLFGVSVSVLYM